MTISKKKGKYYCRFQINNERYFRACKNCKTLNQARLFEAELIKRITEKQNSDDVLEKDNVPLGKLMEHFLNYSFLNKKSYKQDIYRSKVILNYFGKTRKINTIKAFDIESFKGFLIQNICGQTTANRYLENLSKMFNIAVDNGWLNKNPIRKGVKFRNKNYSVRYLTEEEEKRLFKALDKLGYKHLKAYVIVALKTGLRRGNILNLKWCNIDFNFNMIELTENKGNKHIKLYMNSELVSMFKELPKTSEYVFINPNTNKPYTDFRKAWRNVLKEANIENLRFHDLRHTVCTRLIKKGVPLPTVQHIMAHSSIQTTMRYNHIESIDIKNAMNYL